MQNLGLEIPNEFKISAGYALSKSYNELLTHSDGFVEKAIIQQIKDINFEAKKINIQIDKTQSNQSYTRKVINNLKRLTKSFEYQQAEAIIDLFDLIDQLELQIDISEAQNIYYGKIYHRIGYLMDNKNQTFKEKDLKFIDALLEIGAKLNMNVDFYKLKADNLRTKQAY